MCQNKAQKWKTDGDITFQLPKELPDMSQILEMLELLEMLKLD